MLRRLLSGSMHRKHHQIRYNSNKPDSTQEVTLNDYHEVSDKTLDELSDNLESILEDRYDKGADVSLSNGVLTVTVDQNNIYVINKQTPNRQIWLSSPISGPMRFDLVSGRWVEKNSKTELRQILTSEFSQLLNNKVEC